MSMTLDQVVPWGRLGREYELMFNLADADLSGGVLDCGGGPSSFTAEYTARGVRAISVDPVYAFSSADIRARFEACAPAILAQVLASPDAWTWSFHRDPGHLSANRRRAFERFAADYDRGLGEGRYIQGQLPDLPFDDGAFGLAVCSHLLLLYSKLLSEEFHHRAVAELCRVAGEVRLFPLLELSGRPSAHLDSVVAFARSQGWSAEVVQTGYELQRGGNQMLRIFKL